jgi:hypothetical protein
MNATEIIQRLGGPTKAAVICEVTVQAVSQWHRNGIPKHQLKFLKLAHPEVFHDAPETEGAPASHTTESQHHP